MNGESWVLDSNFTGNIRFNKASEIRLNGHTMTVDSGGIEHRYQGNSIIHGAGSITSNTDFLHIKNFVSGNTRNFLLIDAPIVDSGRKVGLKVSGNRGANPVWTAIVLQGSQSNTFTGDVFVSGKMNYLGLEKEIGAIAVRGNIHVSDGGWLAFHRSNQLSTSSVVKLTKGNLYFTEPYTGEIANKFHQLIVDQDSTLHFGASPRRVGKRFLYIDDLLIGLGKQLTVDGWQEGLDFFLVRKDSRNLNEALKKLDFKGYDNGNIHLEDYDKNYWAISATPEPATYGAILVGLMGGLVIWRRRQKRAKENATHKKPQPIKAAVV